MNNDLDRWRQKIDEIDQEIHRLIMARGEVIKEICKVKATAQGRGENALPGLAIRPDREANMLRKLRANHDGIFPLQALFRIWHEIIGAFTQYQQPFKLSIIEAKGDHALWDLARDQFGCEAELVPAPNMAELFHRLNSGRTQLAIIPWPTSETMEAALWDQLKRKDAPNLIMALPFVTGGADDNDSVKPRALVLAHHPISPSGDDNSILLFTLKEGVSHSRFLTLLDENIQQKFQDHSTSPHIIAIGPDRELLVEIKGFLSNDFLLEFLKDQTHMTEDGYFVGAFAK